MRHRSNVNDFCYLNTSSYTRTNSAFTSLTGTFNVCFNFAQTKVECNLSCILSSHLSCIRSILF